MAQQPEPPLAPTKTPPDLGESDFPIDDAVDTKVPMANDDNPNQPPPPPHPHKGKPTKG